MIRTTSPHHLAALVVVLVALATPSLAQAVEYPVLVYSTSTGQHDVPVTFNVSQPSQAVRLCVKTHQAGYHVDSYVWSSWNRRDDAAGLQLNGGNMVTNWNSTGTVDFPADHYEGVGGAFHTVRTCFPVNGGSGSLGQVQASNTVRFRFYGVRDMARSGYRVLDIDVENGSGTDLITGEAQDDPEQWTIANTVGAAYDNAASIAEGQQLWSSRNTLTEINSDVTITAACGDCHATSGFDLKYFNYEPEVIVVRARHHGLTTDQANKITAYILSIDENRPDGRETAPKGRPWNPPYQPGPGLSKESGGLEADWAAGAGIEWVMAHDSDSWDYTFSVNGVTPNPNPSDEDIRAKLHVGTITDPTDWGNRIGVQDIPVAVQYPDWNNWLPDVHPLDAFGYNDFTGTELWARVNEMHNRLDTPAEVSNEASTFRNWIFCKVYGGGSGCGQSGMRELFQRIDFEFDDWGPAASLFDIDYYAEPWKAYLGKLSFMSFLSVKQWEVANEFGLQDLGDEYFGGRTIPDGFNGAGSPIQFRGSNGDGVFHWPATTSTIFDMAPHKSGEPGFPSEGPYGPPGTDVMQYYFSSVWYDLQMIVSPENAGLPADNNGSPVDWSYQQPLLWNAQSASGVSHYARSYRQQIFAWQSRHNAFAYVGLAGPGLSHRVPTNWHRIVGYAMDPSPSSTNWSGGMDPNQAFAKRAVVKSAVEWAKWISSVPTAWWERGSETGSNGAWAPASYTPQSHTSGYYYDVFHWADNAYRMPTQLLNWGATASEVNTLAQWGESMWPNGNWEQWFADPSDPDLPSVGLVEPSTGSTYDAPANIPLAAEATAPGANILRVRFLNGSQVIGTVTSAPYTMTWGGRGPGSTPCVRASRTASGGRRRRRPWR